MGYVRQSKRGLTGISSAHQTHEAVIIQITIPLQNVPLEVVQACGLLQLGEAKKKNSVSVKRWSENQLGHDAPGNLHLKLICAIRGPRIWTGCIEVSWWGTESPAANLSSFFQHHLSENIYSYPVLLGCFLTGKNIAEYRLFIKEPIVLVAQNSAA